MLANGAARARGEATDPYPVLKLYTPDADAAWVRTWLSLTAMGTGSPELGQVSLSMLVGIRGPKGLPVAVEPGYKARNTLAAYVADAQRDGMICD